MSWVFFSSAKAQYLKYFQKKDDNPEGREKAKREG